MSKKDVKEHLLLSVPFFLVIAVLFTLAILVVIANFHSYSIAWKIIIPFLLAISTPVVIFRLFLYILRY